MTRSILGWLMLILTMWMSLSVAFGSEQETMLQMQHQVEQRVLSLVKPYDPSALVFARIYLKTESKVLPGTPFFAKDLTVQGEMGLSSISKALVIIMSQKKPFSQTVLDTAKGVLEAEKIPVVFQVDELPAELRASEKIEPKEGRENTQIWREGVDQLRYVYRVLLGLAVLGLIAAIIADLTRRNNSALLKLLEDGISKMTSVDGNSVTREPTSVQAAPASAREDLGREFRGDEWAQYPEETLEACLADCYWCYRDAYAHFVWKQLTAQKKKQLIARIPFVTDYVNHFSLLNQSNEGWIDDIAYLDPIQTHQLSNEDLAQALKKQPSLYGMLSKMRQAALPLEVHERIMLSRLPGRETANEKMSLGVVPASALRALRKRLQLEIRSDDQERSLLSFSPFSLELAEDVPSLGWLLQVPEEARSQILERFSARDLASAWVAPAEILSQIEKFVPEKKMEVVRSYVSSRSGSRTAPAYLEIHRIVVEILRNTSKSEQAQLAGGLKRAQAA